MFLASNICCVSSATETARNDLDPGAVRGAYPIMKKLRANVGQSRITEMERMTHWRRGKGTMLTASFRRSELS
jgi:hypothetical protein